MLFPSFCYLFRWLLVGKVSMKTGKRGKQVKCEAIKFGQQKSMQLFAMAPGPLVQAQLSRRPGPRQKPRCTLFSGNTGHSVPGRNTSRSTQNMPENPPMTQCRRQGTVASDSSWPAGLSPSRVPPGCHSPTHPGQVRRVASPPGQGTPMWRLSPSFTRS